MGQVQDKVTRFSAELVDDAAAEGARQSRSARQQLDYWVRAGRAVTSAQTSRIDAALAGRLVMADLSAAEQIIMNAELAATIEQNVASASYGDELAAEGVTTVALDDEGRLVEYRPDGTSAVVREA